MFAIAVPYRDRESHLRKFISHYQDIMPQVPIYVIEQADTKHFNRAKLFNVFFKEVGHKFLYVCYHDVDMRVIPELSDPDLFEYPETPTHIGNHLQQFNPRERNPSLWKEVYPEFFGGVCLLSRSQMERVNGWSNEIYSWGIEDDEMRQNIINSGLKVARRKGYFRCEDHERDIVPNEFEKNKRLLLEGRKKDGLSNCFYKIVSTEQKEGYIHINVIL